MSPLLYKLAFLPIFSYVNYILRIAPIFTVRFPYEMISITDGFEFIVKPSLEFKLLFGC